MKTFSYFFDLVLACFLLILTVNNETLPIKEPTDTEINIMRSDIIRARNENRVLSQKNRIKADSLDMQIEEVKRLIINK